MIVSTALGVLLLTGPAVVQDTATTDLPPRDVAVRMIDAYIVSNLQERLALTDEQFGKVLPLFKRFLDDRRYLAQKKQRALQQLRRALMSGRVTEGQVADLLRDLKAVEVEVEQPATLRNDLEIIDAQLTPLQQAQFRIFDAEVEQRFRELIAQIRLEQKQRQP